MKWSVRITPVLASFLAVVLVACGSPEGQTLEKDGYYSITSQEIVLRWKVVGPQLEVQVSAPTEGWVAVGFDPTRMMQDANFIVGYVQDGRVQIRDDYGSWLTSHSSVTCRGRTPRPTTRAAPDASVNTLVPDG